MNQEVHVVDTEASVGTRDLQGCEPGMPVFDVGGVLLGTVAYIYDAMDPALWQVTDALLTTTISITEAARVQLEGCLVVDSGMFTSDYYVLPYQIEEVTEGGIFLNCSRSAVIKA